MSEPTVPPTDRQDAFGLAAALFVALSLFYWISLSPFVDLTGDSVFDPSAGASNRLNQIVTLGLFAGILLHGYRHDLRAMHLHQPLDVRVGGEALFRAGLPFLAFARIAHPRGVAARLAGFEAQLHRTAQQ